MVVVGTEVEPLRALVGQHLGFSDWMLISQEQVDCFAAAIGDHQWIHVDPKRAADGPFGGTVVHGFLVLALTSRVLEQVLVADGVRLKVNYGCDRVRFLAPVPVGSRIRAGVVLRGVQPLRRGVQLALSLRYQVEGSLMPVCVAQVLVHNYA
ncbi:MULTISPECIES: MaoC family dehydratase [unclassified Micromonospora]|uniref:MaoC family dehydratase n=1 Tax=unclassified Micromonospora TaxID=2617518 RepID=UPI0022C14FA7|nr:MULTISPECIES: MaoC family dehydratase [unclassified Micromonospora]WKU07208.1 MaoC family dehydratase [Micromonospora sp. HUAS LYJ1]GHJ06959.1 MaoC family dehydratase [Micromonospora sp. AKA109]